MLNNFIGRILLVREDDLGVSLRAGLSPLAFPLKKREELRQWLNPSREHRMREG